VTGETSKGIDAAVRTWSERVMEFRGDAVMVIVSFALFAAG